MDVAYRMAKDEQPFSQFVRAVCADDRLRTQTTEAILPL